MAAFLFALTIAIFYGAAIVGTIIRARQYSKQHQQNKKENDR